MTAAGQLRAARDVATVTRIVSNGWRRMWCDRCEGNLEEAAECYQIAIGGTVRIYCTRCHRRNQREQAYEPRAPAAEDQVAASAGRPTPARQRRPAAIALTDPPSHRSTLFSQ